MAKIGRHWVRQRRASVVSPNSLNLAAPRAVLHCLSAFDGSVASHHQASLQGLCGTLLRQQLPFSSEIFDSGLYFMLPSVEEIPCSLKLILIVHPNELCYIDRMSEAAVCL